MGINSLKGRYLYLVPKKGLEPSHLAALDPKSSVSTNSTTSAQPFGGESFLVPKGRFELPQAYARQSLKLVRLPIPPLRH